MQRYGTQDENEMTAIIHCLQMWRHYLMGTHFVVRADYMPSFFLQNSGEVNPETSKVAGVP